MSNNAKDYILSKPCFIPPEKLNLNTRHPIQYNNRMNTTITYVNKTKVPIYLITRDGVVSKHDPESNQFGLESQFEIHHQINYIGVNFNIQSTLDVDKNYEGNLVKTIYNAQEANDSIPGIYKGCSSDRYVAYCINIDYLTQRRSIYVTNLDVVISLDDPSVKNVSHPLTLHGVSCRLFHKAFKDTNMDAMSLIGFMIIDNDSFFKSEKFINISGVVTKINSVKDTTRPSGFYVFSWEGDTHKPVKLFELENISNSGFSVFSSYEEAFTGGTPKSIYEEKTAKQKQEDELRLSEAKLAAEKLAFDFKEMELEYKKLLIELEMKNAKLKRELEEGILKRKAFTEEVKWGLGIIAAGLTAVGVILTHTKKK